LVNLLRTHSTIDLQVVPQKATAHPGLYGGFTLYRMPQPYPEVVYVEHLGGALLIETDRAEEYSKAFNHLAMEIADSPMDSIALLNHIKEDLT
jgi:hypothetical protein